MAAPLGTTMRAAYVERFVHGGLRAGQRVYVDGGGGNVAAIAIARRAGAKAVASARPTYHDRCREAGAENVDTGELSARIAEVLPLEATAEVHARLEAGTVTGCLLVRL